MNSERNVQFLRLGKNHVVVGMRVRFARHHELAHPCALASVLDRALEFLRENGLVHRIASRNAFIACVHNHNAEDPVVFMICEDCGATEEIRDDAIVQSLLDHHGNKAKGAGSLGMSRATIYRKIHQYGIITPAS